MKVTIQPVADWLMIVSVLTASNFIYQYVSGLHDWEFAIGKSYTVAFTVFVVFLILGIREKREPR